MTQAARLLEVQHKTVRRMMDRREIAYVRVGRARRLRYTDVARFVEAETIPPVTGRAVV